MIHSNKSKVVNVDLTKIRDQNITGVRSLKFLGSIIDDELHFKEHIKMFVINIKIFWNSTKVVWNGAV